MVEIACTLPANLQAAVVLAEWAFVRQSAFARRSFTSVIAVQKYLPKVKIR